MVDGLISKNWVWNELPKLWVYRFIGDSFDNNNKIYDEYNDYCRVKEGVDHSWSIGTDTRQISLLDPGWQSPDAMREMLNDDIKRRFYILDADIEVSFR